MVEIVGLTKKILKNELSHFNLAAYFKNKLGGVRISKPPVFIVGCGHSGTTMLRHVLGMHPDIYAVPYEGRIFYHSSIKIRMADAIWSFTAVSNGKSRWLEKTPSHIYKLERIFKMYPDSRVLLLIRDGRDVAVSLNNRWGDFERSVQRWVNDNRAGEPYWNHPQVKKIIYEQLVVDYKTQIQSICEFISESVDGRILNFTNIKQIQDDDNKAFNHGAKPRDIREAQIDKGLYNPAGRWAEFMTNDQKIIFKQLAGQMLIEYGYTENQDW